MECDQGSNNDVTDFTADINLDQFDAHKEVTDEDVMHHLDVIENIDLDETFGVDECMKDSDQSELFLKEGEEQAEDKDEVTLIGEEPLDEKCYEMKVFSKFYFFVTINCIYKRQKLHYCTWKFFPAYRERHFFKRKTVKVSSSINSFLSSL